MAEAAHKGLKSGDPAKADFYKAKIATADFFFQSAGQQTYTHTHIHTYTNSHIRTYAHTRIRAYAHTRTYAHTHIHTYTHTHIHTPVLSIH